MRTKLFYSSVMLLLSMYAACASSADNSREYRWYVSSASVNGERGVRQSLYSRMAAYANEEKHGVMWWLCGQASVASAMNFLRDQLVTESKKIDQLDYIHHKLGEYQVNYTNSRLNPHREADINALEAVINNRVDKEFSARKLSRGNFVEGRVDMRNLILDNLDRKKSIVIALSRIQINGSYFGHYFPIYKVDYREDRGGTVYYWDTYGSVLGKMDFSALLDGMASHKRYSILVITRNK